MLFKKKTLAGVNVLHHKNTMESMTEQMPVPDTVYISMAQNIGAPCEVLVSVGDQVKVGQKLGDSSAFVSAPVHSSVSGKVVAIEEFMSVLGTKDPMIVIKSDKKQEVHKDVRPPEINSREDFIKAIRASGLVGLGGAAFPTHIKYSPKNIDEVDTFIVNAAECEPYICSDYRTMIEDSDDLINGIENVMKYLDIPKTIIGIEDNKPKAIKKLKKLAEESPFDIRISVLSSKYPRGAERVMIYETTKRVLKPGKLPAEVGVIVSNVTSTTFISKYLKTGMPLIKKRVTVDGNAVAEPKNIFAYVGTLIYEMVDFCGGYQAIPRKILMGGTMMGRAIYDDGKPMVKNNNAILAFDETVAELEPETACINCGTCVRSCPLELTPTAIFKAYALRDLDKLKALHVEICMECGCCSYACPARKELSLINRLAKQMLKEAKSGK
ncbi:MAG: electron transport complex subunit RsxC [Anaerovoracaceae bacterium]